MTGADEVVILHLHQSTTHIDTNVQGTYLLIRPMVLGRLVVDLVAQGISGPDGEVLIAQ